MNKSLIFAIIAGMIITYGAFAVDDPVAGDKTTTSQPYVKTQVDLKQGKIPAAGTNSALGESVVMYTANGGGEIGERALFTGASDYNASEDADKLITASALKKALTLPETDTTTLECANPSDGCTLWTIVDQTAYGETITLPAGYTRLAYIQTSGTQWIDTGMRGHMNYTYELDFQQTEAGNFRNWGVFNQSAWQGQNMSFTWSSGWAVRWESQANGSALVQLPAIDTNRHLLRIVNGEVYWDGVDKGRTSGHSSSFVFNYNLFLGTINPGGTTPISNAKSKYYSYKVWDSNGNLIQQLIPAKYGNEVGMYDTVSRAFFRNAGSGTFGAGPVVD